MFLANLEIPKHLRQSVSDRPVRALYNIEMLEIKVRTLTEV